MLRLGQKAAAEFIGTFALVFAGCASIMLLEVHPQAMSPFAVPIVFGLVVACMVYAVGHISGAHLNPAVTLAFALARHFPKKEVPAYWLAQCAGAIFASGLLTLFFPGALGHGGTYPHAGVLRSLGVETILSFLLMFVVISVATDTRAEGTMAGAAIGGIVTVCAFIGGPLTGASMNPARSLGPALFEGGFSYLWVYFLGPFLGTILAAFTYQWIRCESDKNEAKGCC